MRLVKNNFLLIIVVIFFISCQTDGDAINTEIIGTDSYKLSVPDYFPVYKEDIYNPLTKSGVKLGKKLFNDPVLSANNKVSCTTCHLTEFAFTDGQIVSNLGVSRKHLKRNTPTLANMLWVTNGLFWDGGSTNLESQALGPLTHADEMGQDLVLLKEELNTNKKYVSLFKEAFDDEVTTPNVIKALAQYQRTLISSNAKYDKIRRNEPNVSYTTSEKKGYTLFKSKCISCHVEPLFTDNLYHNNGLDASFTDTSFDGTFQGRYRVTRKMEDLGRYKTPTLRNIMESAPYMHDGRFNVIKDVLNHYCCNVKNSNTLDKELKLNGIIGVNLDSEDKRDIKNFLKTLSDKDFLSQE